MRKVFFLFVLFLLGLYGYIARPFTPAPEDAIKALFAQAGFETLKLPPPETHFDRIEYHDITLDPDAFSSIKTLRLHKTWTGALTSVDIEDLNLTGELEPDFTAHIAGRKNKTLSTTFFTHLPRVPLQIRNAKIALLSETQGGLTLEFSLQLRPQGLDTAIEASLKGAQKQLSYEGHMNGLITALGNWELQMEIAQAKFALGALKATRISGTLDITGEQFETPHLVADLEAGGLNVFELPFQNASLTLDGSPFDTGLILGSKATGYEDIEFSLTLESLQKSDHYAGALHAERIDDLQQYLLAQKLFPFVSINQTSAQKENPLTLAFEGDQTTLRFSIQKTPPHPVQSFILRADKNHSLADILSGSRFTMKHYQTSHPEQVPLALQMDFSKNILLRVPERKALILDLTNPSLLLETQIPE